MGALHLHVEEEEEEEEEEGTCVATGHMVGESFKDNS